MNFKKLVLRLDDSVAVEATEFLPQLRTLEIEGEVKITTVLNPTWNFIKAGARLCTQLCKQLFISIQIYHFNLLMKFRI